VVAPRERLRETFEEVPDLYDRARPGYPDAVLDDLVELAGLRPGSRVLEIGCGTGQATRPLAERGLDVVCVELGERLAALARRNLAAYPNVEVVHDAFERYEPSGPPLDAVVAFTSFHWVDPDARYRKTARLLREGGALAVVGTAHVLPADGDPFWREVQEDYAAVLGSDDGAPSPPDEVPDRAEEVDASGLYGEVAVRRHVWHVAYTADAYLAVLGTYSSNRSLAPGVRERLLARIRRRIEARPDPRIVKSYLAILHVARRR
jgi:SAM-dependent methyltransferase